jgi:class 3 adenylate cyclase
VTAIAACRTCGTEPLENARFCHGCGSPVEDAGIRAEYKQVTVLFADVVHSMDIASAVGAERLREIKADLTDRCATVVQRYGGTVDKFTGDGIMAVFGAPVALEDHAVRACLAALGVQEEAKRVAVDVRERDDVDAAVARAFQTAASAALRSRICSTAWIRGAPTDCAVALRQAM